MRLDLLSPLAPVLIIVIKTTLLLALGAGTGRALHRGPAAARHLVWLTVIIGALLVPVVDRFLPLRLPVLPAPARTSALPAAPDVSPGRAATAFPAAHVPSIATPAARRVHVA